MAAVALAALLTPTVAAAQSWAVSPIDSPSNQLSDIGRYSATAVDSLDRPHAACSGVSKEWSQMPAWTRSRRSPLHPQAAAIGSDGVAHVSYIDSQASNPYPTTSYPIAFLKYGVR